MDCIVWASKTRGSVILCVLWPFGGFPNMMDIVVAVIAQRDEVIQFFDCDPDR